ncbi:homocysteine biosynthesis protein [Synechococcus sp. Nb3U1]|uniref:homocysteine biosynthesis protein n=1 Tax=Synechococcus sp. Nb3U1 TaxID=1914529 RepID=UPI001F3421AF|nr:homocysteine biosynthesis protein [Synechococcus sp. Nb3U1]MCF2971666.1 homocysteine biosynthesis protein [Synechococcus sp. Nb3U1]
MERTLNQINQRIAAGNVRVWTVMEAKEKIATLGIPAAFEQVDVITTGTFESMESSGAILNLGHTDPPIKIRQAWLNGVPAYAGFGAVDLYLGAAQPSEQTDQAYGGGHVIADLIAGKSVHLRAIGQVTDCYPRPDYETTLTRDQLNQFYLFNPRNAYQNFIVGVNGGDRPLYTYLGLLEPHLGNAVYSNPGELSPLFNDPLLRRVGIGSRIFLGGGIGYVAWEGTQHFPLQKRLPNHTPIGPAATVALIGDAKQMQPEWVRGCYFRNYGPGLMLGVGIPIPMLSPADLEPIAIRDEELVAPVIDFSIPRRVRPTFGLVSYAQLKSGHITLNGRDVRTAPLASLRRSMQVAEILKEWIQSGRFTLTQPVAPLPTDREFLSQNPLS